MSLTDHSKPLSALASAAGRVRRDLQFSRIFTVDLVASAGYVAATLFFLQDAEASPLGLALILALIAAYAGLHVAKIFLIIHLERQGGDARQFVGSDTLVTSGFYGWSRNPVYAVTIVQSLIWTLLLARLACGQPMAWLGYLVAPLLLAGHFRGIDRLVIPHEEAALRNAHPEAYALYARQVRRWFGRRG